MNIILWSNSPGSILSSHGRKRKEGGQGCREPIAGQNAQTKKSGGAAAAATTAVAVVAAIAAAANTVEDNRGRSPNGGQLQQEGRRGHQGEYDAHFNEAGGGARGTHV